MVHTRLAVAWAVDCVSFAVLNLVLFFQTNHLPPHKGIIVRIRIGRYKLPPPIDPRPEGVQVLLTNRWKVGEPVACIGKFVDLVFGYA